MNPTAVGTVIDKRFRILSELGTGGFGTVYKAEQFDLSRIVAIKLMHADELTDTQENERFQREAKILSNLHHQNIVELYAFGITPQNNPYFVMEFLEGRTVASMISESGGLSEKQTIQLGLQVCRALHAVHQAGVIHRDLKPHNIIVIEEGSSFTAKLLDFGLSKNLTQNQSNTQDSTKTGTLLGSPTYMSPEVCAGHKADARSDIYSLACILYECLSGAPPFQADNAMGLLYKHCNERVKPLSQQRPEKSFSKEFEAIIRKCLEKDPDMRYQSAADLESDLSALQAGRLESLSTAKSSGRFSQIWAIVLSASIILVPLTIVFVMQRQKAARAFKDTSTSQTIQVKRRGSTQTRLNQAAESISRLFKKLTKNEEREAKAVAAELKDIIEQEKSKKKPSAKTLYMAYLIQGALFRQQGNPKLFEPYQQAYELCRLPDGSLSSEAMNPLTVIAQCSVSIDPKKSLAACDEMVRILEQSNSKFDLPDIEFVRQGKDVTMDINNIRALATYRLGDWNNAYRLANIAKAYSAAKWRIDAELELYRLDLEERLHGKSAAIEAAIELQKSIYHSRNDLRWVIGQETSNELVSHFYMGEVGHVEFLKNLAKWFASHHIYDHASECTKRATELLSPYSLPPDAELEKMSKDYAQKALRQPLVPKHLSNDPKKSK